VGAALKAARFHPAGLRVLLAHALVATLGGHLVSWKRDVT
jgi:hypothetical protein